MLDLSGQDGPRRLTTAGPGASAAQASSARFGLSPQPISSPTKVCAHWPDRRTVARKLPCIHPSYLRGLRIVWFRLIRHGGDRHVGYSALDDSGSCRVFSFVPLIADVVVSEAAAASFVALKQEFASRRTRRVAALRSGLCALDASRHWPSGKSTGLGTHVLNVPTRPLPGLYLICGAGGSTANVGRLLKRRRLHPRKPTGLRRT
jgi:hypothetical protein